MGIRDKVNIARTSFGWLCSMLVLLGHWPRSTSATASTNRQASLIHPTKITAHAVTCCAGESTKVKEREKRGGDGHEEKVKRRGRAPL